MRLHRLWTCLLLAAAVQLLILHSKMTMNHSTEPRTTKQERQPRILYQGQFGLGHRLSKLTAAYELALAWGVALDVDWGACISSGNGSVNIFEHLFGHVRIVNASTRQPSTSNIRNAGKTILIRNDVNGYYAGQAYKNTRLPIRPETRRMFERKLESDLQLMEHLVHSFRYHHPDAAGSANSTTTTTIGLHLRAGNGEQHHFVDAGRDVEDVEHYVQSILVLIQNELVVEGTASRLLLATDTPRLIPFVRQHARLPVVVLSSENNLPSHGVSYTAATDDASCLPGWVTSTADMMALSRVDILVAGMRSTFTQILPAAMVWKQGGRYCETNGRRLECFASQKEWLWRKKRTSSNDVYQKLMVHLPDPDDHEQREKRFRDVMEYLEQPNDEDEEESVFRYGGRFNQKYRSKQAEMVRDWTFANE